MNASVRIYRCDRFGGRTDVGRLPLADLLDHAKLCLPAHLVEQFMNDLTVLGRARIGDVNGSHFEYEISDSER
jgi:hypothetical protein